MKKRLIYIFFVVLLLTAPLEISAQSSQDLTAEQKKEQLKKRLAELNREELAELERQVELKEREVKTLQSVNAVLENKIVKTEPDKTIVPPPLERNNAEAAVVENNQRPTNPRNVNISFNNRKEAADLTKNTVEMPQRIVTGKTNPNAVQNGVVTNCATQRSTTLEKQICEWAKDSVNSFDPTDTLPLELDTRPDAIGTIFATKLFQSGKLSLDAIVSDFLVKAENSRVDKQVGADSNSSGTTSLAVKGGVPAFLNWAVENGAASSTTSGTTTTFRINPVGAYEVLSGLAPVTVEPSYDFGTLAEYLKRTSVGLTFDISRGSTPNVFTGDKQQLSAISFRYEFKNERNDYKKALKEFFDSSAADDYANLQIKNSKVLLTKADANGIQQIKNEDAQEWFERLQASVAAKVNASFKVLTKDEQFKIVEKEINDALKTFPVNEVAADKGFIGGLTDYVKNAQAYVAKTNELLKLARKGNVFTFEYTNNRAINASDTSNFRLIYEGNPYKDWDFTLNGSFTFYHKKPVGMDVKKVKDFNFASQLDIPFFVRKKADDTGNKNVKNGLFILAFKYQRLTGDAVALDGTVFPNTKGDIAIGQAKVIIPIFKGIKFPISATFANRTELVREKEVRGNFGFTFDVDTLLTLLKKQ